MDQERWIAAQEETRAILESLGRIPMPRNGNEPSSALIQWVLGYLKDRASAGTAEALTPLLRLPDVKWAPIAMVLKGDGPYSSASPRLTVTLRNISPGPLVVEHDYKWTPQPVQTAAGWVDGETGFGMGIKKPLKPGETIELNVHHGASTLRKYTIEAWSPHLWEASGALPEKNYTAEVGFSFDCEGQRVRVPAPAPADEKPRKERVA